MGDVFGDCCQGDATLEDEETITAMEQLIRNISICIITWNVNGNHPRNAAVNHLLNHKNAHLYVIGLQESVDLNAANAVVPKYIDTEWEQEIEKALNTESQKYVHVETVQLFGILLIIFCKKIIVNSIRDVMSSRFRAGVLGVGGNKGAVAIRFAVHDTSICFVCCHLAAGSEKIKERNENYDKIMDYLVFREENNGMCTQCARNDMDITILQHDVVFMFGDLNYRLDYEQKEFETVCDLIENEKWSELLARDQLTNAMQNGEVFRGFSESKIDFQPSYKFALGTNEYCRKKERIPSWCDRILWTLSDYGQAFAKLNNVMYETQLGRNMSDHKPVVGLYNLHQ